MCFCIKRHGCNRVHMSFRAFALEDVHATMQKPKHFFSHSHCLEVPNQAAQNERAETSAMK